MLEKFKFFCIASSTVSSILQSSWKNSTKSTIMCLLTSFHKVRSKFQTKPWLASRLESYNHWTVHTFTVRYTNLFSRFFIRTSLWSTKFLKVNGNGNNELLSLIYSNQNQCLMLSLIFLYLSIIFSQITENFRKHNFSQFL